MSALRIAALSGSLRTGSYNSALLRAAMAMAPPALQIELLSLRGVPVYDGDMEINAGIPPAVAVLKDAFAQADGVLIVTPEYNGGLPGPLKNAIDWMSRPSADIDRVFKGRPLGLMGATPGPGGTRLSQQAWLQPFRVLGLQLWAGQQLFVAGAGTVFSTDGQLTDEAVAQRLRRFMSGFADYVAQMRVRPDQKDSREQQNS